MMPSSEIDKCGIAARPILMHEPLLLALLRKVYWLEDAIQDRLLSLGEPRVTRSEFFLIVNIASGTTHATDIARNLGISWQAVSLKLIELQKRGIINVREDPADRRSKIVSFTEVSQINAELCVQFMTELEGHLADALGTGTMDNFREVLTKDWSVAEKGSGSTNNRSVRNPCD